MIELENVTKTYKVSKRDAGIKNAFKSYFKREYTEVKALENISFNINEGEMVGYIGPNGAGKSTTIKIMCGILTPDSGKCIVNGMVPYKDRKEYVKNIGVVFGNRSGLWWDVPVEDSFELLKEIYNIPDEKYKKQKQLLTEMLNIKEIIRTPTRQLSLGQRMRCEIAAAFLHDPKIVFLDEPTIGLDSTSKIAVRDFIKKINKEKNTTIILTTHDTGDIEALTKRIILIGKGKLLLDGSLNSLTKKYSNKILNVQYNGKLPTTMPQMEILEKSKNEAKIQIDESKIKLADAINFLSNNLEIQDLEIKNTSIDNIVANLYKEYRNTGVQFLGICADVYGLNGQTCSDAKDYIASTGAGYPQIVATEALLRYVSYMPSTHIFDSSGKMIAKYAGTLSEAEWINVIETIMAEYS